MAPRKGTKQPGKAIETPVTEEPKSSVPAKNTTFPDPHSIEMINLTGDNAGPKMRLLRSRRHNDVWMQFDTNPGKEFTDQIKAQGFRWEPRAEAGDKKGAWVKPLEGGQEVRTMLDVEALFRDVGNQIRKSNGLEPVRSSGREP